ncbi:MAG: ribonuclease H-like YkuK family protein [Chloroflexota bacterium]
MNFVSPTKGVLSLEKVFSDIMAFVASEPNADYRLIIGSDSQTRDDQTFVTAIIIHRVGKGARYYYRRQHSRAMHSLRQKIFYETSLSLGVGSRMAELLSAHGQTDLNVEIHVDVGPTGSTRELIREVVGMVVGSGFEVHVKPDSYGASKVADKYTK